MARGALDNVWEFVFQQLRLVGQEQAFAWSRFLLASVALLAVWLDPTQPIRFAAAAYSALAIYAFWSGLLVFWSRRTVFGTRVAAAIHSLDIGVFLLLMYLTDGPTSPFFVFFTFSIINAGLRWGAKGAIATAGVVLVAFLIATVWATPEAGELNRAIVRVAYLVVLAALIALFGWHRERSHLLLQRLSEWPMTVRGNGEHASLEASLQHAAHVLSVGRLAVVWEDAAENVWKTAEWRDGRFTFSRWLESEPPLRASLVGSIAHILPTGLAAAGVSTALWSVLSFSSAIIAPFATSGRVGAVFLPDPPNRVDELEPFVRIVARRIALELEQYLLRRELASAAISRERERLARDMHDGILQDLTAVGLHLEVIARDTPEPHLTTVRGLSSLIVDQQARIRSFVDLMNPRLRRSKSVLLADGLNASAEMLRQQWHVEVSCEVQPPDAQVTESQQAHLRSILSEAAANSYRHGGATEIAVRVQVDDAIIFEIADNGRKPLSGTPDGLNPTSLQQRVSDLGGAHQFLVNAQGTSFSFSLPRGF